MIVRHLVDGAHQAGLPAVVLTFHPHPMAVLRGLEAPFYLSTPEERAALLGALGVDVVVTQPFTPALAAEPGEVFLRRIKRHTGFSRLWVGYDFAMGQHRDTDIARLRVLQETYAYSLEVPAAVTFEGQVLSSSLIRTWLSQGDVESAARALGRPYSLRGPVVQGDGRGRTIGIPTANVAAPQERLTPQRGVYACRVLTGSGIYRAATNIGVRPTFDGAHPQQTVETHLLDFQGNLYGQEIEVQFLKRLRGERRFASVHNLVEQIRQDLSLVREVVSL
ncbi:MAG: bifunctional riboflavin kinase/FAD synthetase [Anaerolineales bacterium]